MSLSVGHCECTSVWQCALWQHECLLWMCRVCTKAGEELRAESEGKLNGHGRASGQLEGMTAIFCYMRESAATIGTQRATYF